MNDSSGNGNSSSRFGNFLQVATLVTTTIFPFVTMAVGWTANRVVQNTSDIAGIKASRYTSQDALRDRDKFDAIKDMLHTLDKKTPEKFPPDWFEQRIFKIESELSKIREEIQHIQ